MIALCFITLLIQDHMQLIIMPLAVEFKEYNGPVVWVLKLFQNWKFYLLKDQNLSDDDQIIEKLFFSWNWWWINAIHRKILQYLVIQKSLTACNLSRNSLLIPTGCPRKNVPLGEGRTSCKGTIILGHLVDLLGDTLVYREK